MKTLKRTEPNEKIVVTNAVVDEQIQRSIDALANVLPALERKIDKYVNDRKITQKDAEYDAEHIDRLNNASMDSKMIKKVLKTSRELDTYIIKYVETLFKGPGYRFEKGLTRKKAINTISRIVSISFVNRLFEQSIGNKIYAILDFAENKFKSEFNIVLEALSKYPMETKLRQVKVNIYDVYISKTFRTLHEKIENKFYLPVFIYNRFLLDLKNKISKSTWNKNIKYSNIFADENTIALSEFETGLAEGLELDIHIVL